MAKIIIDIKCNDSMCAGCQYLYYKAYITFWHCRLYSCFLGKGESHHIIRHEKCLKAERLYKKTEMDCDGAEWTTSNKCLGYGKSKADDEPCDICKECKDFESYGVE